MRQNSPQLSSHPSDKNNRYVSTAARRTQHGLLCRSASTCASTAPRTTGIWVYIFPSSVPPILTVCPAASSGVRPQRFNPSNSLAMDSTADNESRRQRVCHQVLPIQRRECRPGEQRRKSQVHIERGEQVQGRVEEALGTRCRRVCLSHCRSWSQKLTEDFLSLDTQTRS